MFFISKKFEFSAAHSLPLLPKEHKCHRLHGHNYIVELTLYSKELDSRGFASVDYVDLDKLKDYIDQNLDHKNLDLIITISSAEMLAYHLFEVAKSYWSNVYSIKVYETPSTIVEYRKEI